MKRITRILIICAAMLVAASSCKPYHKMTGKETVAYHNKQFKKFKAK